MTEEPKTKTKRIYMEVPMELYEKMQNVIRARKKREHGFDTVERGDIQKTAEESIEIGVHVLAKKEGIA